MAGVSSARKATSGVGVGVGSDVADGAESASVASVVAVAARSVGTPALPDGTLAALQAAPTRAIRATTKTRRLLMSIVVPLIPSRVEAVRHVFGGPATRETWHHSDAWHGFVFQVSV